MTTSTLAAVVAAAAGGDGTTTPEASATTLQSLQQSHPSVYAEALALGATAERTRIAGIEAQSLPGHEAIITAHKADGTKTAADTAMAIVTAEKGLRSNQLTSLSADEATVAGLRNAPITTANEPAAASRASTSQVRDAASSYIAEQAAKGITVSAAKAVAHVTKQ